MTDDKKRRNSLLVSLHHAGGSSTARVLRDELEAVHGVLATLDRVRADFVWLSDVGLVLRQGDLATITQEGRETAMLIRAWPGE